MMSMPVRCPLRPPHGLGPVSVGFESEPGHPVFGKYGRVWRSARIARGRSRYSQWAGNSSFANDSPSLEKSL